MNTAKMEITETETVVQRIIERVKKERRDKESVRVQSDAIHDARHLERIGKLDGTMLDLSKLLDEMLVRSPTLSEIITNAHSDEKHGLSDIFIPLDFRLFASAGSIGALVLTKRLDTWTVGMYEKIYNSRFWILLSKSRYIQMSTKTELNLEELNNREKFAELIIRSIGV